MERVFKTSFNELLFSYSEALDLMNEKVVDHHYDVAFIALNIARLMGIRHKQLERLIQAALVHDVGVFSEEDRVNSFNFLFENESTHTVIGEILLKRSDYFRPLAPIIRHHHTHWDDNVSDVPLESRIIFVADRVAVQIDKTKPILGQRWAIQESIKAESGKMFMPEVVDAFIELSKHESFWLDAVNRNKEMIKEHLDFETKDIPISALVDFSKMLVSAIDFRSRYTVAHSAGVAAVCEGICKIMRYEHDRCLFVKIAGYLHDVGKVVVPKEILDKETGLTHDEMEVVKTHSYYTYKIVSTTRGLKELAEVAANHHEKLDGSGYPFRRTALDISVDSQIVAVADVFTALTETRSYRAGFKKEECIKAMNSFGVKQYLNSELVQLVIEHYDELLTIQKAIEEKTYKDYEAVDIAISEMTKEEK